MKDLRALADIDAAGWSEVHGRRYNVETIDTLSPEVLPGIRHLFSEVQVPDSLNRSIGWLRCRK